MASEVFSILTGRQIKGLSGTSYADPSSWPAPDLGAYSGQKLKDFQLRKFGIELYLQGESAENIHKAVGLSIKFISRLIKERCLAPHPDGLIYGWRGIVPRLHIKPYRRIRKIVVDSEGFGTAGALTATLELHPELKLKLDQRILSSPSKAQLGATKKPRLVIWKWFLDELRKLGYETNNSWPFNTRSNGYNSIRKYIDSLQAANPGRAARAVGGPDLERKMLSGDGVDRPVTQIYERVEMDAHKIDGIFCVLMPHPAGGHVPRVIHRIWVVAMVDIVSKAVLGYHLSFAREVSKDDILRTIKKALSPWKPRPLSFGNAYAPGAGFPGNISDNFLRACWNETSVDGALAETCKHVKESLESVVGSTLVSPARGYSSRRSKDDRPFIEAFFRQLGIYGFQRISNTTGGKAGGAKGRDPALIAVKCQFQYEYAEELLDVLIANYNATPHTTLGYRSPLQYLSFLASHGHSHLRYADPISVQGLLSYRKKCRVLGGLQSGKRPYVNFEGARYSNETLGQRYDLVGTNIWIVNHLEDDARVAQASLENGMSLGILRAAPPWHQLPHSLKARRVINSCMQRGMLDKSTGTDAVEKFLNFCEEQRNSKLPVHSMYLELRRILTQLSDSDIETGMRGFDSENSNSEPKRDVGKGKTTKSTRTSKLPARRVAITKPRDA